MLKKIVLFLVLLLGTGYGFAQSVSETEIPFLKDECWWGGFVAQGSQMPYLKPIKELDLETQNFNNQGVPLLLSNKGRYVWSDNPFKFEMTGHSIKIRSNYGPVGVVNAGTTLRQAYLNACEKHFRPSGTIPDSLLFSMPQYNTWIELMYNQNQTDVLKYANDIIKYGFPKGVLMIDDNWQKYYGNFDFKPDKFPDPVGMVNKLHAMGFKVMVWISPFVSPDSPEFRELEAKGYLLKDKWGGSAMVRWWNGYSACYDLTNPAAFTYFVNKLKAMQKDYKIDGFKLDAGDVSFYGKEVVSFKKDAKSVDHTMKWAEVGLEFPFNEYRACWKMGGQPLVQRLGDKNYSWNAIGLLIPDMISAGLLGYPYACPDMIGGGQYGSFLNIDQTKFDQALIVRSAQTHALMPMMQFSVAPWRVLNKENLAICSKMAHLHAKMGKYILICAKHAAKTGEPIIRHMEYMFPNQGFANCKDQFMLGEKYLIAPILTPDNARSVKLPKGKWRDDMGRIYSGGRTITIRAGLERLPYFEKIR